MIGQWDSDCKQTSNYLHFHMKHLNTYCKGTDSNKAVRHLCTAEVKNCNKKISDCVEMCGH